MNETANNNDQSGFWHSRRVCVTGGAGFLGSFVVENSRAALRGKGLLVRHEFLEFSRTRITSS
jgi:thioester reductase-like protein